MTSNQSQKLVEQTCLPKAHVNCGPDAISNMKFAGPCPEWLLRYIVYTGLLLGKLNGTWALYGLICHRNNQPQTSITSVDVV